MLGMRKIRVGLTICGVLAVIAFAGSSADAQSTQPQTDNEINQLELRSTAAAQRSVQLDAQANALANDVRTAQENLVAMAARRTQLEQELATAEANLDQAINDEAYAQAALADQSSTLQTITGALARQRRGQPTLISVTPQDAAHAARSSMALSGVTRTMDARMRALRAQIDQLASARARLEADRQTALHAQTALNTQRDSLLAAIGEKQRMEQRLRSNAAEEMEKADTLAAQAQSLRELMAAIEAENKARRDAEAAQQRAQNTPPQTPETQASIVPNPTPQNTASPNTTTEDPATGPQLLTPVAQPDQRNTRWVGQPSATTRTWRQQPRPQNRDTRFSQNGQAPAQSLAPARSAHEAFASVTALPVVADIAFTFRDQVDGRVMEGLGYTPRPRAQVVAVADGRVAFAGSLRGYGDVLIIEVARDYYVVVTGLGELYARKGQWVLAGEPVGETPRRGREPFPLYVEFRTPAGPVDPQNWLNDHRRTAVLEKPA